MFSLTCFARALTADLTEREKALVMQTEKVEESKKAIEYVPIPLRALSHTESLDLTPYPRLLRQGSGIRAGGAG